MINITRKSNVLHFKGEKICILLTSNIAFEQFIDKTIDINVNNFTFLLKSVKLFYRYIYIFKQNMPE